jgi:hypothetical protein
MLLDAGKMSYWAYNVVWRALMEAGLHFFSIFFIAKGGADVGFRDYVVPRSIPNDLALVIVPVADYIRCLHEGGQSRVWYFTEFARLHGEKEGCFYVVGFLDLE